MSPALAAAVEAKLAELAKNPPKRACVFTVRRPGQKAPPRGMVTRFSE